MQIMWVSGCVMVESLVVVVRLVHAQVVEIYVDIKLSFLHEGYLVETCTF